MTFGANTFLCLWHYLDGQKQQQAASVLARNLKQLVTRNAQRSQAIKRKREEEQEAAENKPSKKVDVGADKDEATASTPEMHPCENCVLRSSGRLIKG